MTKNKFIGGKKKEREKHTPQKKKLSLEIDHFKL